MAGDFTSSADGLAVEAAKASGKQQRVEEYQPNDHGEQGEMRKLGNHGSAETFAGVNERIDEHGLLQDRELVQRAPGIVSTAKENHGSDDEAEHQADVGLLHAATESEATGRREKSHEHGHNRKEQGMGHIQVHARAEEQRSGGEDPRDRSARVQRASGH